MQAAQLLAAEILEIVQDLKEFYTGHEKVLNDAPDLQRAVISLLE